MNPLVGDMGFPVQQVIVLLIEAGESSAFESILLDIIDSPLDLAPSETLLLSGLVIHYAIEAFRRLRQSRTAH